MPTREEFIEAWPLYTRASIVNFSPPKSITRTCGVKTCKKDTTWLLKDLTEGKVETSPQIFFKCAGYTCGLCGGNSLLVVYRLLDWKEDADSRVLPVPWHYMGVQKIGQIPPQSVEIDASLAERLSQTAGYYKNALVCRSQNYGIAAVAYMRRVVEEKTDELIDVMVALAQTYGVDSVTVETLLKAKDQVQFEQKVKVASEVVPDALKPGGVNPLGQLYKHLSVGVHGKTDDECIAVFDDLRADFEYVFRNLYVQATEASGFAVRVQQRAGRKE
jgi:hypothetical protein